MVIRGHLGQGGFKPEVVALGPALVNATLDLHAAVSNTFLPSAVKFQYQFNLRELSAIVQVTDKQSPMPNLLCQLSCASLMSFNEV